MPARAAKRLLILGWDAADWRVIDGLLARGAMPALGRVIRGGVRADLGTLEPKLSPLLWTTVATGKTADKHGILGFAEPDPSGPGIRIVSSTSRKTKALWNILTQAGLRTNVVGWYASHPAEPIGGVCISNLFQEGATPRPGEPWPLPGGAVHPPALAGTIGALRVHPGAVAAGELRLMVPRIAGVPPTDRRIAALVRLVARCESVHRAACAILRLGEPWDCTMVFHEAIDVAGHHFMQYAPPRMRHIAARDFELLKGVVGGVYQLQDRMLSELLRLAGPDTTVLVLSDHGFCSDHQRPEPGGTRAGGALPLDEHAAMDAAWHRSPGVLAMGGPGVRKGAEIAGAGLLDIAPTALALLGLPAGADMDGRVLVEALDGAVAPERIPSWDAAEGPAGLHPPTLRQDPFEARQTMAQLVELGYLAPFSGSDQGALELVAREARFNLAVVYMTTGRIPDAEEILTELARAFPAETRYVLSLARCHAERGRFAEARAVLTACLADRPGDPEARLQLGAALFAEGRLTEACAVLEALEREQAAEPRRVDRDCLLGTVYFFLRRFDDAARILGRAAAADPRSAQARHGLALAALGRERFEEAAEECLAAVGLLGAYPDAHYTLGVALAWLGDFGHAIQSFGVALSIQPGMVQAHRFLAAIYGHLGDGPRQARHEELAGRLSTPGAGTAEGAGPAREGSSAPLPMREHPMGPSEWARRHPRGVRSA